MEEFFNFYDPNPVLCGEDFIGRLCRIRFKRDDEDIGTQLIRTGYVHVDPDTKERSIVCVIIVTITNDRILLQVDQTQPINTTIGTESALRHAVSTIGKQLDFNSRTDKEEITISQIYGGKEDEFCIPVLLGLDINFVLKK